jgi:chromosome partitioning protein
MPIITIAQSKGGAGKSTTAVLLSLELERAGATVTLIDGDSNKPLLNWSQLPHKPDNLTVVYDSHPDTILDTIDAAAAQSSWVIIDPEGRASELIGTAMTASDFVLIPSQPSILDAKEASKTVNAVRKAGRMRQQDLPFAVYFNRVPSVVRIHELALLRQEFERTGLPVLTESLVDRIAYRTLFTYGGTLDTLPAKGVGNINSARDNAEAFCKAVVDAERLARQTSHIPALTTEAA